MRFNNAYRFLFCALSLGAFSSNAAVLESFDELPNDIVYDFIVVGGGTAGNVIASYLVEDPATNVIVLEAGPSNAGILDSEVPFFAPNLVKNGPYNWNYTTVPQIGVNNRTLDAMRGHVLGGSSSINWMIYTRGSAEDWDRFAHATGDEGWGWKSMLGYFKKSERWNTPADGHNTTGQFEPEVHGFDGKIGVSLSGYPRSIDPRIMDASRELGGPYAYNLDLNSGYPLGVGYEQATISGGMRSSSATGYLTPVSERPNLHVLLHARVSRLLQTTESDTEPTFLGVEFRDSTGTLRKITAKREIILSAGTLNTPQILMNSGIGNSQDLAAIGVDPIVHLPDVGANLSEHPIVTLSWLANDNHTYETLRRDPSHALEEWKESKTGPFTNPPSDRLAFGRVPFELPAKLDLSAGPNTPHFEILFSNGLSYLPVPELGNFFALSVAALMPASRGSLKLASSYPFAPPLYDPGFYTDMEGVDLLVMREAIHYAFKFLTAPAWDGYLNSSPQGLKDNPTDEELNAYIKNKTSLFNHPVGTASMSPNGVNWGVTNPDLTVKGVVGVRVIDASVMPYVIAGHTSAAVYGIAERGADLIKAAHGLL